MARSQNVWRAHGMSYNDQNTALTKLITTEDFLPAMGAHCRMKSFKRLSSFKFTYA